MSRSQQTHRPVRRLRRPTPFTTTVIVVLLLAVVRYWLLPGSTAVSNGEHEQFVDVQRVIDGDTFDLNDGRRIRMLGIDAPEMGFGDKPREWQAEESTDWLRAAIEDQPVRLVPGPRARDRYGRTLAWVYDSDGQLMNAASLRTGMARLLDSFGLPPELEPILRQAEAEARVKRLGIWSPQPRPGS